MIKLKATKASLTLVEGKEILTSGMANAVSVSFEFSPEWEPLRKTAVFSNGITSVDVIESQWDNYSVNIPHEILEKSGRIVTVGVYGTDGEKIVIPTVVCGLGLVLPGTDPNLDPNVDPTLPVYEEILKLIGNLEDLSTEAKDNLVNAINEIYTSGGGIVRDVEVLAKQISDLQAFVGYTDSDIYGVEVDFVNKRFTRLAGAVNRSAGAGFDNIAPFGGRKRCNLTNDGKVVAYYGEAGFTTTGKLTQAITIVEGENAGTYAAGTIVQTMVEQPKFYYKVVPLLVEHNALGSKIRKARYYVSATPKAGFKLHPAFIENDNENEKIYLAAFEGSLWDASASAYILDDAQVADFANDMLCSIANAKPASGLNQNLTRANTRKLAQKRGSGWEQGYAATAAASQLLMLVEYASFNVQSVIGNGAVNKTDDGATSMTENSGATVSLGNASGAVTNANGIQIVSYRGEENFWGNIWWWVDGMNEQNPSTFAEGDFGTLFVADHGFADGSSASPYKNTGIHPCYGGGYVSAFGWSEEFDWMFIPAEKNGNSSLPVGDYYWNANPGWRIARLGRGWDNGADGGAFCWYLADAASNRGRSIGGRLVYVPSKKAA